VRDDDLSPTTTERYWLVHANGSRQLIDPREFDIGTLTEQARRIGGRLVLERWVGPADAPSRRLSEPKGSFEPPVSSLGGLFNSRLCRIHKCKADFELDINERPTNRVLGNYYKTRRLIRIYSHDSELGRRPLEELFDTFLHEVSHHLEYTEFDSFDAQDCGRVPGRMHSRLFWKILGELKIRWRDAQRRPFEW
jgi:hypothetical protein